MAFFMQILFDLNGNVAGKGTSDYATADAAEQAFHTAIAAAINRADMGKIIAVVFDENGTIKLRRVWERNAPVNDME